MKHKIVGVIVGAILLLSISAPAAFGEPKGDKVKVKGEVVDMWCFLEGGDRGPEHKQCAIACAKAGNPIGLVTDAGDVYVMMGMKGHQPARDFLIAKMASVVTVEGTLVKQGGVQVIYVSSVD